MKIILRNKPVKNNMLSLYLDIHDNGERYKKYLQIYIHEKAKTPDQKQYNNEKLELVKKIIAKYELDSQYKQFGISMPVDKRFDFLEYFQEYIDNYNKKDKRNHQGSLNNLKEFLSNKYAVKTLPSSKINKLLCEDFAEYLKEKYTGHGPVTYWKKFKKVLKRCYAEEFIKLNPDVIEAKFYVSDELKKEILELDELVLLWNSKCSNDEVKRAFLYCALCSGYAWTDVKGLTFKEIDATGLVKKDRNKTNIRATTYMSDLAKLLIPEIKNNQEKVFKLDMTANGANKSLKLWVSGAGINKHITWHCARHTFATLLNDLDLDLRNLAAALGHSEKSAFRHVMRYTRVKNRKIEEKVDKISEEIIKKLSLVAPSQKPEI